MQAEHLAGIDQQHHHLAQQHALGHHDPTILAAHHQALAAAQDSSQHLPPEALDTSHAQYTAQVLDSASIRTCMDCLLTMMCPLDAWSAVSFLFTVDSVVQGIPGAEHLSLHALQQHALPSEITLNLQGPPEA